MNDRARAHILAGGCGYTQDTLDELAESHADFARAETERLRALAVELVERCRKSQWLSDDYCDDALAALKASEPETYDDAERCPACDDKRDDCLHAIHVVSKPEPCSTCNGLGLALLARAEKAEALADHVESELERIRALAVEALEQYASYPMVLPLGEQPRDRAIAALAALAGRRVSDDGKWVVALCNERGEIIKGLEAAYAKAVARAEKAEAECDKLRLSLFVADREAKAAEAAIRSLVDDGECLDCLASPERHAPDCRIGAALRGGDE